MASSSDQIFFITGVSTGLGRAIAQAALDAGHRVVGTLRDEKALAAFEALAPGRAFGRLLDVTRLDEVAPTVDAIEREIGPISVAINNAGYGHEGLIEESSFDDLRRQFEVNVFGAVAVLKAVAPHMRGRRAGHIVNITSVGGIVTYPGLGIYHGSKFALEGISEALGKELAPFGVHVTAVEPGAFRTDWAGRSMVRAGRAIPEYDAIFNPEREARAKRSGNQAGDPARAGQAILQLVASANPPAHLLLGRDAIGKVREKIAHMTRDIDTWQEVTLSTDFA
ncbi:oxidoreductase [Variovorax sp. LjRoot290]|uniref:oxidoreductase n=1 Tax=Variovorax sp. LjRoot290 TaxID=3342316 RepID=UPI003ECE8760